MTPQYGSGDTRQVVAGRGHIIVVQREATIQ